MQGEYRGDFTRDTFRPADNFSRVLLQQGRVQLDADWNEQTSILLHSLRGLAADLIGQHGGPDPDAFAITPGAAGTGDFQIAPGRYYVDGLLCENVARLDAAGASEPLHYFGQPGYPLEKESNALPEGSLLVYLDVWESHITWAQQGSLREVALGGPDTATRARVVWQVKVATELPAGVAAWPAAKLTDASWRTWTASWQAANRGRLKARVQPQQTSTEPCLISPDARYRGAENQLYRVEIHDGGTVGNAAPNAVRPTYKWSRENSSVFFPVAKLATAGGQTTVTLHHLGRDSRLSLQVNDWAELLDDQTAALGLAAPLLKVVKVDPASSTVTLAGTSPLVVAPTPTGHPVLRRWEGRGEISESNGALASNWLALEDGIQVQFQPAPATAAGTPYRSGDYWLIPARAATGDIEWPLLADKTPAAVPPHGVEHHYAPLAYLPNGPETAVANIVVLRRAFNALAT